MDKPVLTCRQLIDFIVDYVAGELDDDSRAAFERHLQSCSSCQSYLESYRTTLQLARTLTDDEPAEGVPEELVQAILRRGKR